MEGEGNKENAELLTEMVEVIEKMGSYVEFRMTQRKECLNLVRRLKLLVPLLEEIRELVSDEALSCLLNLRNALFAAKKLLKNCNSGSKIYLVSSLSLSLYLCEDFI